MRHRLFPLLVLLASPVLGQERRPPEDPLSPHVRGSWEAFVSRTSGSLAPNFDAETGLLSEARGALRVAPNGLDEQLVPAAGRLVVRQLAPVLGVPEEQLVEGGVASARGGLFHVRFRQEFDGVPVQGAVVSLRFSAAGDLMSVRSRGLWIGEAPSVEPLVSRSDALELSRISIPGASEAAWAWGAERALLPDGGRLAWQVSVSDPELGPETWRVMVDATTGVALYSSEAVARDIAGTVEGFATPSGTMELHPEAKLPLANLRVRSNDWSAPILKMSADDSVGETLVAPDGSRTFWTSSADGDLDIWTALIDGSDVAKIVDDAASQYGLSTNTDGSVLYFTSTASGDPDIWKIGSDGSGLTQLTSDPGVDTTVSVTRAGDEMTWQSNRDGDFEIFLASTDGSGVVQLTSNALYDGGPVFAGFGDKIGFLRGTSAADASVWAMDSDGSGALEIGGGPGFCADLSIDNAGVVVLFEWWKPGKRIRGTDGGGLKSAHGGRASNTPTVWAASTDGFHLEPVDEEYDGYQVDPFVAGDNEYLAFSERNGDGELDIVHMEIATRARVTLPLDGDQYGVSLSDDGQVGAWVDSNAWVFDFRVTASSIATDTDSAGNYSFPYPDGSSMTAYARLRGRFARVDDDHPSQKNLREVESATGPSTSADFLFNSPGTNALKTPQVTGYYQTNAVHDFMEGVYLFLGYPSPLPFDEQLLVNVNDPAGLANAYYDPFRNETRYYVGSGAARPNTCFDSVVFHEYGHFMDEMFGRVLTPKEGLTRPGHPREHAFGCSEGIADWIAMLTSGSAVIGADFYGAGTAVRDYTKAIADGGSADRQWDCLDCKKVKDFFNGDAKRFESHQHGESLAGFGNDLRTFAGALVAEQILLDTLAVHPDHMVDAVSIAFDVDLLFNGGANFDALCAAARRHGFDCPPAPDFASHGCAMLDWCGPLDAHHIDTGYEMLGFVVDPEPACEFPAFDEDGLVMPSDTFMEGETVDMTLTVSVDPRLLASGRYGGVKKNGKPNPLHYLYVHVWLLHDDGGEIDVYPLLGTGSGNTGTGVPTFPMDCFAIQPDADWGILPFHTYDISITMPEADFLSAAILRVRLDYGEDGGRPDLKALSPLNNPGYFGDCGSSRSGEVEDYQILIVPE